MIPLITSSWMQVVPAMTVLLTMGVGAVYREPMLGVGVAGGEVQAVRAPPAIAPLADEIPSSAVGTYVMIRDLRTIVHPSPGG